MVSKCVVRGSINHDEYFFVDEISKPGETKSSKGHESRIGGKGANQAVSIVRAGGNAQFYGTVGKDGVWIVEDLAKMGIETGGIVISNEDATGRAIIQVSDDGENSIILFPGTNHNDIHERRHTLNTSESDSAPSWFPACSHLLLQNEISFHSTLQSLEKAKAEGLCTVFNPSPMLSLDQIKGFPWGKVDWLVVNEGEAEALWRGLSEDAASAPTSAEDTAAGGRKLASLSVFGNTNIICTFGANGVLAFVPFFQPREDGGIYIPGAKLQGSVRDTTGAGDCFTGYFVAGLMEEFPPGHQLGSSGDDKKKVVKILKLCNQAAGMSVERQGTIDSVPHRAEVLTRMGRVN